MRRREQVHHLDDYEDRVFGRPQLWCHECKRVFLNIEDHELMRDILLAAKVSAA